jgi:hypothetical protein
MRILLSLLFVGFVLYAARAIFTGEETTPSSVKSIGEGAETTPPAASGGNAPEAQALTAEELAPSPANSKHAITVEQAALPAKTSTAGSKTSRTPSGADLSPATEPHPSFVKVMSPASIREGPSTSAAIIGVAQPGAEAQVVSQSSDWVEIIDPGSKKTGWIHRSFLAPQAVPSAHPVPQPEVDAALATPDNDSGTGDDDMKPSVKRKKRKHASRHRHHHRHGIAFGWVYLPY